MAQILQQLPSLHLPVPSARDVRQTFPDLRQRFFRLHNRTPSSREVGGYALQCDWLAVPQKLATHHHPYFSLLRLLLLPAFTSTYSHLPVTYTEPPRRRSNRSWSCFEPASITRGGCCRRCLASSFWVSGPNNMLDLELVPTRRVVLERKGGWRSTGW